ncbi:glycine--tRNA ligase [Candidatus Pacearchaeota archaeon]|nr:glycine--tRNA ligase [Candidatus Pacearchaeota archaeon]
MVLKGTDSNKKSSENESAFVSFLQEAGLIWGPEPEIYGGLAGFYTYGPLGKLLKNKVENSVREVFNFNGFRELECPTVMPDRVWKASGHLETFSDRIITCSKCKAVFRADKLIEEKFDVSADGFQDGKLLKFIRDKNINCLSCGGRFGEKLEKQSLMMKTKVAGQDASLRPETATVTYLPFIRMYQYFRKKLPFGVFQIGKAYRNEISPRQSVLRGREFTQAEGQLFIDPKEKNNWEKFDLIKDDKLPLWDYTLQDAEKLPVSMSLESALKKKLVSTKAYAWCLWLAYAQFKRFGVPEDKIRIRQHHPKERAFYASDAWDIELKTNNYGWVEVCGVHDRTDYDLKQHSAESGTSLEAIREDGTKFTPHILEIAFGTDRPTYALIDLFYEKKSEGDGKTTFKIPYKMAPISVSVFPLMKKPELVEIAEKIFIDLSKHLIVDYDVSGSIGKRYLRSMTSGVPFAVTIDYDSIKDKSVTVRDRDSGKQERIKIVELVRYIDKKLQ